MTIKFRTNEADKFRRLASNVRPVNYTITIQPDFRTLRFNGSVLIELQVLQEARFIELNSLELEFSRIELQSPIQGALDFA